MTATLKILKDVVDAESRILDATVDQGDDIGLENLVFLQDALARGVISFLDALRQSVKLKLLVLLAVFKHSVDLRIDFSFVGEAVVRNSFQLNQTVGELLDVFLFGANADMFVNGLGQLFLYLIADLFKRPDLARHH